MSSRTSRMPRARSTPVIPGIVRSVITRSNARRVGLQGGQAVGRLAERGCRVAEGLEASPGPVGRWTPRRPRTECDGRRQDRACPITDSSPCPDRELMTAGRYTSNVVPSPGRALHHDRPFVILNHAMDHRQAESRPDPGRLGREERLEQPVEHRLRHPRPGVDDRQAERTAPRAAAGAGGRTRPTRPPPRPRPPARRPNRPSPARRSCRGSSTTWCSWVGSPRMYGASSAESGFNADRGRGGPADELQGLARTFGQANRPALGRLPTAEHQDLADQVAGPVGGLHDLRR